MLQTYKEHNEWAKLSHTITFHYNSLNFCFQKVRKEHNTSRHVYDGWLLRKSKYKVLGILESRFGLFTVKNLPFNYNSMNSRAGVINNYLRTWYLLSYNVKWETQIKSNFPWWPPHLIELVWVEIRENSSPHPCLLLSLFWWSGTYISSAQYPFKMARQSIRKSESCREMPQAL